MADKLIRVLYVEDDQGIRGAISQLLTFLGYDVACEANGQLGVEKAISWLPRIILMDIRMPVMDGIEATRLLRQNSETADIPILILSAYTDATTRAACREAGCNGFLAKPIDMEKLNSTIQETVASTSAQN